MLKLAATGEDHDRFLHDGGTRGTSIPLGLGRNLRPFPPKIISARGRIRVPHTSLPASAPLSVLNSTHDCAQFSSKSAFHAAGNQFAKLRALPHHKLFVRSVWYALWQGSLGTTTHLPRKNENASSWARREYEAATA